MNRRDFFKLSLGALTATALGPIIRDQVEKGYQYSPFILYGDGYHDDTEAFQALMNGHSVLRPDGSELKMQELDGRDIVYIPTGTYNLSTVYTELI